MERSSIIDSPFQVYTRLSNVVYILEILYCITLCITLIESADIPGIDTGFLLGGGGELYGQTCMLSLGGGGGNPRFS